LRISRALTLALSQRERELPTGGEEARLGDEWPELLFDLAGLGETAELSLGEEQLVPVAYLKDAAPALDQLDVFDVLGERPLELIRQPGGMLFVPSRRAVFDAQVERLCHWLEPLLSFSK
jgi:hypothetical protein